MAASDYSITKNDITLICEALKQGMDVRLHPDKYGLKITAEKVKVLRKPEPPRYGFSDKRD